MSKSVVNSVASSRRMLSHSRASLKMRKSRRLRSTLMAPPPEASPPRKEGGDPPSSMKEMITMNPSNRLKVSEQ